MTTSYVTRTTITDNMILVESFIGTEHKISSFDRGQQENQNLATTIISHKQRADVVLNTGTVAQRESRQAFDSKALLNRTNSGQMAE